MDLRLALPFVLGLTACVDRTNLTPEVPARKTLPVSVCTTPLTPPPRKPGDDRVLVRNLDAEQWLKIMVPQYEPAAGLSPTATDCTGYHVFANETLRFGVSTRGWPRLVDPNELDARTGPKGLTAIRLNAVTFQNGDVGGPVALVRALDDRAEIYGIGSFRGPLDAKVEPVRMGNDMLVVAEYKRCPDITNCRRIADFFLLRRGRLLHAATTDVERVLRVPSRTERGLYAEYRLTTDVSYKPEGIQLLEQVKVKIIPYPNEPERDSDRTLRTVEFSRMLRVDRDALFATNESLWERVVGQD
ncbi:MAG: hypothetical protein FJ096_16755 [Deltaproteobacteria bacterium]|nr:hypothetical protein [Deltaproteobacteria bacterium]